MVDPRRVEALAREEAELFRARHPMSGAAAPSLRAHWPGGVPMHWMRDWGTPWPLVMREARGTTLKDIDGHEYADFCLGDTGAMFGHSPPPIVQAIAHQAGRGLTAMLVVESAVSAGERLASLFGIPFWQMTQTATDANRASLRWARALTGRRRVLVFTGCYHGTVDEVLLRPGGVGPAFDAHETATAVEFDDFGAITRELRTGEYAAVLCEPVMTNAGMVLPSPGLHEHLRRETRAAGSLLVIDETHTLSTAPGGYTRAHGLEPDFLVCGKAIAGGFPCAVYGFTPEVDARMSRHLESRAGLDHPHTGIGTTLAANPLALAALDAALTHLHVHSTYAVMNGMATTLESTLSALIARRGLDWHVSRVGARLEIGYGEEIPRNATQALAAMRPDLEGVLHLSLLNRGVLLTPFHNMMLCSPVTGSSQVDALVRHLDDTLDKIA